MTTPEYTSAGCRHCGGSMSGRSDRAYCCNACGQADHRELQRGQLADNRLAWALQGLRALMDDDLDRMDAIRDAYPRPSRNARRGS